MGPVTDPEVIEAIEAEYVRRVYEATREAELQRRGLMPPPSSDPRSRACCSARELVEALERRGRRLRECGERHAVRLRELPERLSDGGVTPFS